MGRGCGEGNGRRGGWLSERLKDEGTREVGYKAGELGVCLRPRLRGIERESLRGIGVKEGRVEGGCRDECRVDNVRTERIGEGVAVVVWDDVEAELKRLGEPLGTWMGYGWLEYR